MTELNEYFLFPRGLYSDNSNKQKTKFVVISAVKKNTAMKQGDRVMEYIIQ